MPLYLPWLAEQVRANGAEVYTRRVNSLRKLVEDGVDAIVNCSGLAARELVGDQSVYPVRGQIARVNNPGLTMSIRDEQHPEGRAYVHPREHDCILGGTMDENSWDTRVDLDTAASILRRCREIAPTLAEATVIKGTTWSACDLVGPRSVWRKTPCTRQARASCTTTGTAARA